MLDCRICYYIRFFSKCFFVAVLMFVSLCMVSCGELDRVFDSDDDVIVSDTSVDSTTTDTWGAIYEEPAEVFFASDLSAAVRHGVVSGLVAAANVWGNYGPLEYWVLGTDKQAGDALAQQYCDRCSKRGDLNKDVCIASNKSSDYGFESYRKVGYDAIQTGQPGTSMGRNGARDWGIHRFSSSYPLGFDSVLGASPKEEIITVFHEYFHAV